MIDFQNGSLIKLSACKVTDVESTVSGLYVDGGTSMVAAKGTRDFIMFTNKRIITVNVQGMTGKKKDITSIPYSKIQAFSIESAGPFDRACELEVVVSGLGAVKLEFAGSFDLAYVAKLIGWALLS